VSATEIDTPPWIARINAHSSVSPSEDIAAAQMKTSSFARLEIVASSGAVCDAPLDIATWWTARKEVERPS
jgi:hypothetical protein